MLTIRATQIAELARVTRARFEREIAARLLAAHPVELAPLSSGELAALVSSGIDRAIGYGMATPSQAARFLEYMVRLGPSFDADPARPWIGVALADGEMNGAEKLAFIGDCLERQGS